jgi:hypothetical protein
MNREECIAAIRNGAGKFSLSEILVVFPRQIKDHVFPQRIPANDGFITSSSERFRISVLAGHDADIPQPGSQNFAGREDFGFAKGIIDLSLFFRVPAVQPSVERQQFDRHSILHFDFDRIEFASEVDTARQATTIHVTGLLLDYKLIAPDKRTVVVEQNAFFGERSSWRLDTAEGELLPNWRFALIQRDKDLEFHLEKDRNGSFYVRQRKAGRRRLPAVRGLYSRATCMALLVSAHARRGIRDRLDSETHEVVNDLARVGAVVEQTGLQHHFFRVKADSFIFARVVVMTTDRVVVFPGKTKLKVMPRNSFVNGDRSRVFRRRLPEVAEFP